MSMNRTNMRKKAFENVWSGPKPPIWSSTQQGHTHSRSSCDRPRSKSFGKSVNLLLLRELKQRKVDPKGKGKKNMSCNKVCKEASFLNSQALQACHVLEQAFRYRGQSVVLNASAHMDQRYCQEQESRCKK